MNPLGLVEALIGAMNHSALLTQQRDPSQPAEPILNFTKNLKSAIHNTFRYGQGTRDMCGPDGLTTEVFIDKVAWRLGRYVFAHEEEICPKETLRPKLKYRSNYDVDRTALQNLFNEFDKNKNGTLNIDELEEMLATLGIAPMKDPAKRGSASSDNKDATLTNNNNNN